MLFQHNDINPCTHKRFCDDLELEQHRDDFLVCGATQGLETLAEEFKGHFLVRKAEIVSLKPSQCNKLVTNMLFQQNDINPCIYKRFCDNLDLEQHGDDLLVCELTSNLEVLADEFKNNFFSKKAEIVSLKPGHQNDIHFLKRRISVDNFGWHVELEQRYVKSLLDAMAMNHCKSVATPGSKGQESSRNVADLSEKLVPQEHREFRSGAGICQNMTEQRCDVAFSTKEIMREAAGPTTATKTKLKRIARYLKGRQRCVLNFPWVGKLDDVVETGLETQRHGAPRPAECWQSVRASLFDMGL